LQTELVSSAQAKLRVLSASKAVACWIEGNAVVGKIVSISGNTITAGNKFTICTPPFSASSTTINKGVDDNEFIVITQSNTDNGCAYISKFVISGNEYVSNSSFAKLSPAVAGDRGSSSCSLFDPEKNAFVSLTNGQTSAMYSVSVPTSI
jgi:hypothetical protein